MTKEEAKEYWTVRYEAARNWDDPHWEASERKDHRRYVDALKVAIEALSERTGEWIYSTKQLEIVPMWECSCCRIRAAKKFNFCPHCGADMRGEQDE